MLCIGKIPRTGLHICNAGSYHQTPSVSLLKIVLAGYKEVWCLKHMDMTSITRIFPILVKGNANLILQFHYRTDSRARPVRSARTAPAHSPQGRGEQGACDAEMACRLPTAARTLRTVCSAVFPGVQRVSARHLEHLGSRGSPANSRFLKDWNRKQYVEHNRN